MQQIDVRDLACPEPVIRTKQAIEANPNSVIGILINNQASVTNVTRMAKAMGAGVETAELPGGEFRLTVTTSEAPAAPATLPELETCDIPPPSGGATVFIRNNVLGHGADELGRILMKAFLKTLKSATPLPKELIFINNGVHLTSEGSEELATLAALGEAGVEIVSCGTCLDFYGKLDRVRVGIVGNMFDIVSRLNWASKIIVP